MIPVKIKSQWRSRRRYVSFVTDTGKSLEAAQRSIAKKEEEKAEKEAARLSAISSKKVSSGHV